MDEEIRRYEADETDKRWERTKDTMIGKEYEANVTDEYDVSPLYGDQWPYI